jgi:soluble lytic murein transglycosylase-like protein
MIPVRTKVSVAPYVIFLLVVLLIADSEGLISLTGQRQATARPRHRGRQAAPAPSSSARADIPGRYLRLYRQAGARHRLRWTILAGVGKVESGHGANMGPSSAGALGPMQFMPGTWRAYGRGSVWRPEDAIPAAARLLVANGARSNVDRALHLYNSGRPYCRCSVGYVLAVKAWAARYQAGRR